MRKLMSLRTCARLEIVLLILLFVYHVHSKDQYVLPLNMGMKSSIPYDIANILNRPNRLQGGLAIFLSFCLLAILWFGVITSPFGYMFGIPSQKYVLGDLKTIYQEAKAQAAAEDAATTVTSRASYVSDQMQNFQDFDGTSEAAAPRGFMENDSFSILNETWSMISGKLDLSPFTKVLSEVRINKDSMKDILWKMFMSLSERNYNPDPLRSFFYWMPQVTSESCQLLTLCYSHGMIKQMPNGIIQTYRVFSRKFVTLPIPHKEAIRLGFQEESDINCGEVYGEGCPETLFTLVLKSILHILPDSLTSSAVPTRKAAMYM